jgi:HAD superfamily hydrolase (TIGR01549 family)
MAERPTLEAVVFDAGGTLVRLDFEWMAATATQIGFRTTAAELRRAEVAGRRRYDASAPPRPGVVVDGVPQPLGGRGDVRAYFGGMLLATGMPHHLVGVTLVWYLARERTSGLWARQNEGARETLDAVAAMGLRRCVVSNSDGRAAQHLRNAGVLDGLEFVVDSFEQGIEKPDPGIFRVALDRLGVDARRALYVGDIRSVDEVGARAAGMPFVLIDPAGDYGDPGGHAIRAIGELPDWIERHFTVRGAAEATVAAARGRAR